MFALEITAVPQLPDGLSPWENKLTYILRRWKGLKKQEGRQQKMNAKVPS